MKRLLPAVLVILLMGASPPPRPVPNAEAAPDGFGPRQAPVARAASPEEGGFSPGTDWEALGAVLVQDAGRRKPLEAFAREKLWRILGSQTRKGQPPVLTLFSMCFDPAWDRLKVLKAGHPDLVRLLGGAKASLEDLGSEGFEHLMEAAERKSKE